MNARAAALALSFCALASAAIYVFFFTLPYPVLQYYATPLLDLGKLTQHAQLDALAFMAAHTTLFVLYVAALLLTRTLDARTLRWIAFAAPVLFCLVLVFTFPIGAIDVYDYAFHSKMLAFYHVSPAAHVPNEFASDTWFKFIAWRSAASPYGPIWIYLSALIYFLAGGDLLLSLLGFKLLEALALLACGVLVYWLVRHERARDALSAFVFVAWNPLLLGEMAMNGHNDVLMILCVLIAWCCFQRKYFVSSVIALVMGALIKAPALALAPVLGIAVLRALPSWRMRARFVVSAGVAALAVLLLAYAPLWSGDNPFATLIAHQDLFTTSPAAVAWHTLELRMDADAAKSLVRVAALLIFCVAYVRVLWNVNGTFISLARSSLTVMLLLLVVVTFWFQPWYLVWVVPLAPLATRADEAFAVVFSWSALWDYFIFDFAWFWNFDFFNQGDSLVLNASAMLLIFLPPLIYWLSTRLRAPVFAARTIGASLSSAARD